MDPILPSEAPIYDAPTYHQFAAAIDMAAQQMQSKIVPYVDADLQCCLLYTSPSPRD